MSKEFGENLKNLRKQKGLYQVDLASQFNVSQNTISMWESGKTEPDFETLQNIAYYFGVSQEKLLGQLSMNNTPNNKYKRIENALRKTEVANMTDAELDDFIEMAVMMAKKLKK